MGFLNNLKRSFKEVDYMTRHPFQTHIRQIKNQDLLTGEQLNWVQNRPSYDSRIKNLRDKMQKYDIEQPETIESIEQKINEIHTQLKNSSDKQEKLNLLHELDYLYDKLEELNSKKELYENNIDEDYEK